MAAELIATDGPLQGVVLALDQGTQWLVGRDPQSCQLVVEDPKVERQAFRIKLTKDGYSIESVGKTPVTINQRTLEHSPLSDGDVLKIGDTSFSFYTIQEFEEIVFSGADSGPVDEELIAREKGEPLQRFESEESPREFSDEDLPKEEKKRPARGPKEEEFRREPAGRKRREPKGPKEEEFAGEKGQDQEREQPLGPEEEEFAKEKGQDHEKRGALGPSEEGFAGEPDREKASKRSKGPDEEGFAASGVDPKMESRGGPSEENFARESGKDSEMKPPSGPSEEGFSGEAEKQRAQSKPQGPSEEGFAGEAEEERDQQKPQGPSEEGFAGETEKPGTHKKSGPLEEGFSGEAEKEKAQEKPRGPSEEGFDAAGTEKATKGGPLEEDFARESGQDSQPQPHSGPSEEGFAGEAEKEKASRKPQGPSEEGFAGETEKPGAQKKSGPLEEGFAGEAEKERAQGRAQGPSEEGFAGETEKERAQAKIEGPSEEGFSGEAEKQRAQAKASGPMEEGFSGGAEKERAQGKPQGPSEESFSGEAEKEKARGKLEGPSEEGFSGEAEKEKARGKRKGPSEEGFAGETEKPSAKKRSGPSEEGFSNEGISPDDWENVEGEAEDFEEDELAEEAGVKKEEPSRSEELISEGADRKVQSSKEKQGEDLVSEGADKKEEFHEKQSEELISEGADREKEKKRTPPGEELITEGHDREETRIEKPGEELISEGEEVTPAAPRGDQASLGEQLSAEGNEAMPRPPESEDFEHESFSEGDHEEEPLFSAEEETAGVVIDMTPSVRFLLKVVAGPNTGAEFALDMGRSYLIGTEASTCDIVFHDLSVSREHARLYLSEHGELEIEDLGSRNGVLVDQDQITGRVPFSSNVIVTLGTTAFFVVDREAPQETLVAPTFEAPRSQPEEEAEKIEEEEKEPEPVVALKEEKPKPKPSARPGLSIYVSIVCGLAILLGISMISLFHTSDLKAPPKDYVAEIKSAIKDFPSVKYTYSPNNNRLFLVGHVATGVEKDELFYNLNALSFLKGIDDHVVNDEAVWQEMNILLSKQPDFKGVSMHSPRPAVFVLNGYLKTEKQEANLIDWVNIHFNYLSLLENRVVVEESVIEEVSSQLVHNGFGAVAVSFLNGELTLAGYVGSAQAYDFERLVHHFGQLPGVRNVQNFVVVVAPEQQVIDLNQRYPGRFKVTGYSKHGDVSINVVINGHILMRGDTLEGMTLTSIQPHAVFFEKDGLKYKLEYNK